MRHAWIVDVLGDIGQFARQNNLPELAAQIDLSLQVAAAELGAIPATETAPNRADPTHDQTRRDWQCGK